MSVQGRIMVLGHLAEAQYRLGDWDAAAVNGALAVSLVRDAGVLLGAGVANALAAYVAAGRGDWETAEERVSTAALAARAPALVGRPGARRDGPGGARPGPRRPRRDARGPARATPTRPSATPSTGSGCSPGGRCASRRCSGSAGPTRRRPRSPSWRSAWRAPAGLVGAGGGPAAVRDRGGLRDRRRGAPGLRAGDGAGGAGARRAAPGPPRDGARPVPARRG